MRSIALTSRCPERDCPHTISCKCVNAVPIILPTLRPHIWWLQDSLQGKRPPGREREAMSFMGIIIAGSAAVAATAVWIRFIGHIEKAMKEADRR